MNFLKNPIFNGITEQEYEEIKTLGCTRKSQYAKDQTVFCTGDQTAALGILLSGELHIENIDLWGNRIILHNISAGEAFDPPQHFRRGSFRRDLRPQPHPDVGGRHRLPGQRDPFPGSRKNAGRKKQQQAMAHQTAP